MKPGSTCEEILGLLSDYAEGELDDASREAVEAHLASCRPCTGELTLMRALVSGLHRIPEETAPPAILEAIMRRVPAKKKSWWPFSFDFDFSGWQLASGGAFAAALAVALLFVLKPAPPAQVARTAVAPAPIAVLLGASSGTTVDGRAVTGGTQNLAEGARIEVAASALPGTQIAFNDGSAVSIDPSTKLVAGAAEVRLESGTLELSIEKQKLHFRVRTPGALVTVWGTRYRVTHKTLTTVEVQEGKVQVQPLTGGEGVMLEAGQRVEVDGSRLEVAKPLPATDAATPEDTRLPLGDDR